MVSPIRATFDRLRRAGRKALIPFIVGGDPALSMTGSLVLALQDAGADLIEVGIPFSDPLADGPTIQAASSRALAAGATPERVLRAVEAVRARVHVPLVGLCYWNLVIQFDMRLKIPKGVAQWPGGPVADKPMEAARRFIRAAQASGLSGLIVPDLPVEESGLLRQAVNPAPRAKAHGFVGDSPSSPPRPNMLGRGPRSSAGLPWGGVNGQALDLVLLASPTSPPERLRAIVKASQGFIYYVSVTGTTGARASLPDDLSRGLRQVRMLTAKPICVGFGIATPAQARAVSRVSDGVIIGSALIEAMRGAKRRAEWLKRAGTFIRRLRRALP